MHKSHRELNLIPSQTQATFLRRRSGNCLFLNFLVNPKLTSCTKHKDENQIFQKEHIDAMGSKEFSNFITNLTQVYLLYL